jgi:hypothetical protein
MYLVRTTPNIGLVAPRHDDDDGGGSIHIVHLCPPPDDVAFRCVYRQYGGLIGSRISNWTQAEVCTTIVRGLP